MSLSEASATRHSSHRAGTGSSSLHSEHSDEAQPASTAEAASRSPWQRLVEGARRGIRYAAAQVADALRQDDEVRDSAAVTSPAAELVGRVLAPPHVATVVVAVMCWVSSPTALLAVAWFIVAAGLSVWGPVLIWNRLYAPASDSAAAGRSALWPSVVATSVACVGVALQWAGSAPHVLSTTTMSLLATVAVSIAVLPRWPLSVQVGVAAWATTVLAFHLPGPWWGGVGISLAVTVALAWSRVRTGRRRIHQVVAGALLGVLVTGTALTALA